MLRVTKVRLIIDFGIQFLLFILLAIQLIMNLTINNLLFYTSIYGILLSVWQIIHAIYVVRKHQDWQRRLYLRNMQQVLAYSLLTLGVGFFMLLVSFGFLVPFFLFTIYIMHWLLCMIIIVLAIDYFRVSLKRLYEHLYRPKSFWDLN